MNGNFAAPSGRLLHSEGPSMEPTSHKPPLYTLWQPTTLMFILLIGEGLALILSLAPGNGDGKWITFGLLSFTIQWIVLIALSLLFLVRLEIRKLGVVTLSYVILAALLLSTCFVGLIAWWFFKHLLSSGGLTLLSMIGTMCTITLVVGMLSLAAFQNHWQAQQLAVKAKQAELEALTARIRPHFLFNTLNAGAALVHGRPEEAERLLLNLADLFRAALSGQQEISLEDELALAKGYVEIESLRFAGRLNIQWELPSPLPDIKVPALSIQPLIENAVKHGMEPSSERVNVEVIVKVEPHQVKISVLNDMPKNRPTTVSGYQVGLLSSRERIRALSRGRAELDTRIENNRFIAVISLPTDQ
mgnify:CR=1 FL=1